MATFSLPGKAVPSMAWNYFLYLQADFQKSGSLASTMRGAYRFYSGLEKSNNEVEEFSFKPKLFV